MQCYFWRESEYSVFLEMVFIRLYLVQLSLSKKKFICFTIYQSFFFLLWLENMDKLVLFEWILETGIEVFFFFSSSRVEPILQLLYNVCLSLELGLSLINWAISLPWLIHVLSPSFLYKVLICTSFTRQRIWALKCSKNLQQTNVHIFKRIDSWELKNNKQKTGFLSKSHIASLAKLT